MIDANRARRLGLAALVAAPILVLIASPEILGRVTSQRADGFLPPGWYEPGPDGEWFALGTDYLGRPFSLVLARAAGGTARIALLGTLAVVLGSLAVGLCQGSTRSRGLEGLLAAGNLGVMAVPEVAVIIALASAWPRTAPAAYVNASMVATLVLFAVPPSSRLIAERVRSVGRSGFVAASRASGATPLHTFRHEVWPHLTEDLAWIAAAVLPRFVAAEVGLAYLGVEYRDFEGLGRSLSKGVSNMGVGTAVFQLLLTIAAILWVAILPLVLLRVAGLRRASGVAE